MEEQAMVEKKKKTGAQDPSRQKNEEEIRTEARRRATEQGRDWKSLTKEERQTFRKEARAALNK
jgi:hypothetical protein